MASGINTAEVLVADGMGILLTLLMLLANYWKINDSNKENRTIIWMLGVVLFSCVADIFAFISDGRPGTVWHVVVYVSNMWLFLSNVIVMPIWLKLVVSHIRGGLSKGQRNFIYGLCIVGIVGIIINFFSPILFSIDSYNVYTRGPMFVMYILMEALVIIDGVAQYIIARRTGGVLKFFPVWQFVTPVILGIAIQGLFYGIATIWPFVSISLAGLMVNLQNESLCYDKLTGLYNRYYLDNIKREIQRMSDRKRNAEYTVIMMDMNRFKAINDEFGHAEGDAALIKIGHILKSAVGSLGSAVRYAGDEFIVILNTYDEAKIAKFISDVREGMKKHNEEPGCRYKLGVAIGYCVVDLKNSTVDEVLNEVDKKMYEDKRLCNERDNLPERRMNA